MDTKPEIKPLVIEDFITTLKEVFSIPEKVILTTETNLAEYILDSIDLGELLAVLKQKYQLEPKNTALFSKYSKLEDVLKIINGQLTV